MGEYQAEKIKKLEEGVQSEMKDNPAVHELMEKYGAKIKEIKILSTK